MRTAALGTEANVALTWKRYNDQHGMNWRIEVVATKEISSLLKNLSGLFLTP
jgi:hypothetical protein